MGKHVSLFFTLALLVFTCLAPAARAVDLPLASASPLAGIGFDDKPLYLPVQRNFQMAMLTAGSELGRTCGKMEAYGWRMSQSEQSRVDQIFNSTVDRMRGLGYVVEMQSPNSISRDITMFTADRPNRHLLTMWSAGDIGLVMVLCETSAPPATHTATGVPLWPSVQTFPPDVMQSKLENVVARGPDKTGTPFSPLGTWVGSYVCGQGYTGATLLISRMRGNNFEGVFHFYPTAKNPSVPDGRYMVYGQYDADSARILINPGQWLQRPPNFYNTIMVGSFDTMENTLSAYFQGINGCTSFEAHHDRNLSPAPEKTHHKHAKKKTKKAAAFHAKAVVPAPVTASVPAPATSAPQAAVVAPVAPAVAAAPAPVTAVPPAPAAVVPEAAAPAPPPAPVAAAPAAPEKPPLVVGEPTPAAPAKTP